MVKVDVKSSEDIWAIKVTNLNTAVQAFLHGEKIAREIPVFGFPLGEGIFMVGLVDELRFDPDLYTIDLSELKTRQYKSHPSKAQVKQHKLQVMLYKVLFDDLVKGKVSKEQVAKCLRLDLKKEFGEDVKSHLNKQAVDANNLDELMNYVLRRIQTLTCVNQISVEYVYQDTKETLSHMEVIFDEDELRGYYSNYLKFWRGQRPVEGVDIEEAWKCQKCDFSSICEWREKKALEYANRNKAQTKKS